MKNEWENASFLIEAKKCIDSLYYIADNVKLLSNLNLRERIDNIRQKFYINIANLLDEIFDSTNKKKTICNNDSVVNKIYYERDKKAAHKDNDYMPRNYNSLQEEIDDKKIELNHVRTLCSKILPSNITLDYVPHDKELFRLVNRINAVLETDVNKIKYPNATFHSYQLSEEGKHIFKEFDTEKQDRENAKIFGYDYDEAIKKYPLQSIDDVSIMSDEEKRRYAVIIENGINSYEGLQNRQDSCIKTNLLFKLDIWCQADNKRFEQIKKLKEIGFLDAFEIPHLEILENKKILDKVLSIISNN